MPSDPPPMAEQTETGRHCLKCGAPIKLISDEDGMPISLVCGCGVRPPPPLPSQPFPMGGFPPVKQWPLIRWLAGVLSRAHR
jgi:hypothetical protein